MCRIISANGNMPPLTYRTFVNIMDLVGNPNDPAGDPDYNGINCPVTDNYEESFALPSMNDLGKPINNVSKIVIETFFHYDLSIENII